MTVIFHDIHQDTELEQDMETDKILGVLFHEILYADDTSLVGRHSTTVESGGSLNWKCD